MTAGPAKVKTCAACGLSADPCRLVKERVPGSAGRMAHSFAGQYWLCVWCLARVKNAGGMEKEVFYGGKKRPRLAYVVVLARSIAWLRTLIKKESCA